ncbi:MAG TPA: two-component sensor histidine kinase, partial [Mycobacterium sp.]
MSRTKFWLPRTWSLRLRLLVTQVVLLAVVCACIGGATAFALQRFLSHQLDDQLLEAGRRSTAIFDGPFPLFGGPTVILARPDGSAPHMYPGPPLEPGPPMAPPPPGVPGPPPGPDQLDDLGPP